MKADDPIPPTEALPARHITWRQLAILSGSLGLTDTDTQKYRDILTGQIREAAAEFAPNVVLLNDAPMPGTDNWPNDWFEVWPSVTIESSNRWLNWYDFTASIVFPIYACGAESGCTSTIEGRVTVSASKWLSHPPEGFEGFYNEFSPLLQQCVQQIFPNLISSGFNSLTWLAPVESADVTNILIQASQLDNIQTGNVLALLEPLDPLQPDGVLQPIGFVQVVDASVSSDAPSQCAYYGTPNRPAKVGDKVSVASLTSNVRRNEVARYMAPTQNTGTVMPLHENSIIAGPNPTQIPLSAIAADTTINYVLATLSGGAGVDFSSGAQISIGWWGPDQGPSVGSPPNSIPLGGIIPPAGSPLLVADAMPFQSIPSGAVLTVVVQWNSSAPPVQTAWLTVVWNITT